MLLAMKSRGVSTAVCVVAVAVVAGVACSSSDSTNPNTGGTSAGGNAGAAGNSAGSGGSHAGAAGSAAGGQSDAGANNAGAADEAGAAGLAENAGAGGSVENGGTGGTAGHGGSGGGAGSGEQPQHIDAPSGANGISPQIGVDDAGNAMATWMQNDSLGAHSIWANRYLVASGKWGAATRLDGADSTDASPTQLAVAAGGSAIVVWAQPGATATLSTWARRFTGSTWSAAKLIENDDAGPVTAPVVGMDAKGNAVAVWNQSAAGGVYTLRSSSYTASSDTWSTPIQIETGHVGNGSRFHVAVGAAGDAVAAWTQNATGHINVWASRLVFGTDTWSKPVDLQSAATSTGDEPMVAMNASGVAVVEWTETASANAITWSARSTGSTTWGAPVKIQSSATANSSPGAITIDAVGDAEAIWSEDDGSVWVNRYSSAGNLWQSNEALKNANSDPYLVGNALGGVVAVWLSGGLVKGG